MEATIIISVILALIVGLIIYRMVRNSKSGKGQCVGCAYSDTCAAAKYLKKRPDKNCPDPF
jgi:hypothetical protein